MSEPEKTELELIVDQLDEMLADSELDPDDALEVAALAGLASRLGASPEVLAEVATWVKDRGGRALLDEAWEDLDVTEYTDGVDDLLGGESPDEDVQDAIFDFDELVAAAIFDGRTKLVRKAAAEVESSVRAAPELFSSLASYAKELARTPAIARNLDVYGYWLAIADCPEPDDEDAG